VYLLVYVAHVLASQHNPTCWAVETGDKRCVFAYPTLPLVTMDLSYFDLLWQHFEQFIPVSDAFSIELQNRVHTRTFHKGELIHNSDYVCTKSYFIRKGLARTFYLKDGTEISEYFSSENEWINSPKSFIERTLDVYNIDALEDTHF